MRARALLTMAIIALSLPVAAQRYMPLFGPWNGEIQASFYGGLVTPLGSQRFEFDHIDGDFLAEGGEVEPASYIADNGYGFGLAIQMVALEERTWRWGLHIGLGLFNSAYHATFHGSDLQLAAGYEQPYLSGADYRFNVSALNADMRFGAELVWMPSRSLQVCAGGGFAVSLQFKRRIDTETFMQGVSTANEESSIDNVVPRLGMYANAAVNYFITEGIYVGVAANIKGLGFIGEKQDMIGSLLTARLDGYRPAGIFLQVGLRGLPN